MKIIQRDDAFIVSIDRYEAVDIMTELFNNVSKMVHRINAFKTADGKDFFIIVSDRIDPKKEEEYKAKYGQPKV